MNTGIIAVTVIILAFLALKFIIKFSLKLIGFFVLVLILLLTAWICVSVPSMHKPFSVETIEYLLKFNGDGSVTSTKQVTRTVLQHNRGEE